MEVEVNPSHDTVDQWEAAVGGLGDDDSKNWWEQISLLKKCANDYCITRLVFHFKHLHNCKVAAGEWNFSYLKLVSDTLYFMTLG